MRCVLPGRASRESPCSPCYFAHLVIFWVLCCPLVLLADEHVCCVCLQGVVFVSYTFNKYLLG